MCKHGTTTMLRVLVPASHSHTGEDRWATKGVDACIAPLVESLNREGFGTIASCCGHGHRPGNIALRDGRELFVIANFNDARALDEMFPLDIHGGHVPSRKDLNKS